MSGQTTGTFLDQHGLLCVAFSHHDLPVHIAKALDTGTNHDVQDHWYVLLANAGPEFWRSLARSGIEMEDPVDRYSDRLARQFARDFFNDANPDMLYPGTTPVPLMTLGELAGWSGASPLGLGIHNRYGLWFAYRALFRTCFEPEAELLWSQAEKTTSACLDCEQSPCVNACPAQAVSIHALFNIDACADFRTSDHSACAGTCLARRACPVGQSWQYDDTQLTHHMRHSLDGLLRWRKHPGK